MNNRTIITMIVAGALVLLVMCVSVFLALSGLATAEKYSLDRQWSADFASAQSMKIIDLTGDGQDDLFLQNEKLIQVLDSQGKELFARSFEQIMVSSMGDVNGDGGEDVIAFYQTQAGPQVLVLSRGQELWIAQATELGDPSRVAVVRFPGGTQVVAGDMSGRLMGFSVNGQPLWTAQFGGIDYIRGLDDARIGGQIFLAAANHDGTVGVLDERGVPLWLGSQGGILRRLRAYDLDGDGNGELVTGGENSLVRIFDAATGGVEAEVSLGQTITEIREVEINGDPSSREIVVGGKDSGVWALTSTGSQLWTGVVGEKVNEIAAWDVDKDGKDEVLIGDDAGGVNLFTPEGDRNNLLSRSAILRMDVGSLGGARVAAIADSSQVQVGPVVYSTLPGFQFTPLLVGLLVSAVILATAWFVATMAPKPPQRITIQDGSAEGLLSNRRMLKESIADVDRLKKSGEMTADAYLLRLKELREMLAENEAALKKAGVQVRVETFNCPHCGGKLQLGVDRCDYCGQVILS